MNTHGFELKSFGLEIVNDLPGYWTGLMKRSLETDKKRSSSDIYCVLPAQFYLGAH